MCPAHVIAVLDEAKTRRKSGQPVVLVATQLVESGVDISFPVVYRAECGLDSFCLWAESACKSHFVPTITLYEIARYTSRVAGETATEVLLAFLHQHSVSPLSPETATLAATLGLRHKLAMADALIYATARHHKATLWTQDDDFKGLPHVRYFPKIKP
jgi:predicted nucleic acid-binding protein